MANLSLSTQIPQIGDSSQQLLARMASVAADQNQNLANVIWLSSGSRTTPQYLTLSVPQGVKGIVIRMLVTAVPGVDQIGLLLSDGISGRAIFLGPQSSAAENHHMLIRDGGQAAPGPVYAAVPNLPDQIQLITNPSGVGSFTYSVQYRFLK